MAAARLPVSEDAGGRWPALEMSMAGWVPMNADWWPNVAECLSKPWPNDAILMDLRWWQDQIRTKGIKRPGRPTLRNRWGVSDRQVRNALKSEAEWGTPLKNRADSDRTATGQRPDSDRTARERNERNNSEETDSGRTAGGQQADSERPHARSRSENREQTTENNTRPAKPSEASVPGGWDEVVEAYRAYRKSCGVTRLPNPKPKLGQGKQLVSCLSVVVDEYDGEPGGKIGPERLVRLLRWLSTSGHSRAQYYRSNSCDAENIRRHVSALWGLMMAEADSPSQASGESSGPDLWSIYVTTARLARFDFDAFRARLPPDDRDRIIAASRACRAFGRLKDSSNDFQRREIADDFRKALEANP